MISGLSKHSMDHIWYKEGGREDHVRFCLGQSGMIIEVQSEDVAPSLASKAPSLQITTAGVVNVCLEAQVKKSPQGQWEGQLPGVCED